MKLDIDPPRLRSREAQHADIPLLSLEEIHVSFGGTAALVNTNFSILPGEIVGLLGHNGAGKSTLVNVATGALRPQRGKMFVQGDQVMLRGDPRDMDRFGIKVIHQVPALADNLSIYDNITLGKSEEGWSRDRRREVSRAALALLGSSLSVDRLVGSLQFGEKQIVDLARALSTKVNVLLLDEPTGALGQRETDNLHSLLRRLALEKHGIVYVSHRLRDILAICTRIVVLSAGQVVLDRPTQAFSLAELSDALAPGVSARQLVRQREVGPTEEFLKTTWRGQSLDFSRGEIVGLFGMAAGPQFYFLEALFGLGDETDSKLEGRLYRARNPRDAIRLGVYYVSADRERDGLILEMSAVDNLLLPWLDTYTNGTVLTRKEMARTFRDAAKALNIRGGAVDTPIGAFSAGNRQKIVIGRWIFGLQPRLLLLSQPTQGVDIGARTDIARALRKLADQGVTILVASSEADEIALLCERAVICEGERWQECPRTELWEEQLLEGLLC